MKETVLDCDFIILNRLPHIYSAQRFQAEINRLKLNAKLISPEVLIDQASQIEAHGLRPAILYRQGDYNFWATHEALSKLPFKTVNSPSAFLLARDKWTSHKVWTTAGIPSPITLLASSIPVADSLFASAREILGAPFIFKKRFSSQGRGVFLIKDSASLKKILEADLIDFQNACSIERAYFSQQNDGVDERSSPISSQLQRWMVQECIKESLGNDVRAFATEEFVHAIERKNQNSFRSNLHQGGHATATRLSADEHALIERVHAHSKLSYSGIDFLRTRNGLLFLEVNPSPGFEGIENVYPHLNIAATLLSLLKTST